MNEAPVCTLACRQKGDTEREVPREQEFHKETSHAELGQSHQEDRELALQF